MNAPRYDWGAPEPGGVDCGCGGGCGDGPPHMPRGSWERDDDELGGLQPPKLAGPVPDWDPDEQGDDDLINAKARAAAHFGAWALATDPDVIDMGLPNVSMDVYFSAGPSDRSPPFGCSSRIMGQHNHTAICTLYRVRLRAVLTTSGGMQTNVEVTKLLNASRDNVDRFQPVLSPDGRSLAYTTRYTDADGSPSGMMSEHSIDVLDMENKHRAMVSASGYSGGGHQFPMWRTPSRLAWTIGDENSDTAKSSRDSIGSAVVQNDGGSFRVRGEVALLGQKAGITSRTTLDTDVEALDVDFADSDQQPATAEPNDGGRNVVMHSKDFTSEDEEEDKKESGAAPIVVRLSGNGPTVEYERFELGIRADAYPVPECHHPSWSSQNEIMCHDHIGTEIDDVTWRSSLVYLKAAQRSTVWYPSGSGDPSSAPVDAFPLPSLHGLLRALKDAHRYAFGFNRPIEQIRSVSFKYSRFTPNLNYIVSTVMISSQTDFNKPIPERVQEEVMAVSRVVLIHRTTSAMWDLTTLVEAYEGAVKGSFGAFAPSCAERS